MADSAPAPVPPPPRRMSFGEAIRTCLRKYVTFSGRASRPEYWWFVLFTFLVSAVLGILDSALFGAGPADEQPRVLQGLGELALFLPGLAAGWRRMHDTGRSGLMLLFPLIAWVATVTYLVLAAGVSLAAFQISDVFGGALAGTAGAVGILALAVAVLSPLIVLWWLTRPSQPGANSYGPNPQELIR